MYKPNKMAFSKPLWCSQRGHGPLLLSPWHIKMKKPGTNVLK